MVFAKGKFPDTYTPTVFENYQASIRLESSKKDTLLSLWDTAGQEDYDRIRPYSYPNSDVVLLAFSIDNATSLENVLERVSVA